MFEKAQKKDEKAKAKKKSGFWETVRTVVYAVLIALLVRTFAYEPFNIPSGSMTPTLLEGDYLFVSKFSYGYSRYSFPFGFPPFGGRLFGGSPERGDVAVFKLPLDNKTDYIKRIVGLPGDRIQVRDGILYINDQAVERRRVDDYQEVDVFGRTRSIPQYVETLPDGRSYRVLDRIPNSALDNTEVYVVPKERYFAMGDNRDNSIDSRVSPERHGVGFIPAANMIGRAERLFFSTDGSAAFWEIWKWPSATRFERILKTVS